MELTDLAEFTHTLRGLALAVQLRMNTDGEKWNALVSAYWEDLRDIPLNALREACRSIRVAGGSFPSSGALRSACREYQTEATSSGCGSCRSGISDGSWWSPVYGARIEGLVFCHCGLGQRKADRAGAKVQTRQVSA